MRLCGVGGNQMLEVPLHIAEPSFLSRVYKLQLPSFHPACGNQLDCVQDCLSSAKLLPGLASPKRKSGLPNLALGGLSLFFPLFTL